MFGFSYLICFMSGNCRIFNQSLYAGVLFYSCLMGLYRYSYSIKRIRKKYNGGVFKKVSCRENRTITQKPKLAGKTFIQTRKLTLYMNKEVNGREP